MYSDLFTNLERSNPKAFQLPNEILESTVENDFEEFGRKSQRRLSVSSKAGSVGVVGLGGNMSSSSNFDDDDGDSDDMPFGSIFGVGSLGGGGILQRRASSVGQSGVKDDDYNGVVSDTLSHLPPKPPVQSVSTSTAKVKEVSKKRRSSVPKGSIKAYPQAIVKPEVTPPPPSTVSTSKMYAGPRDIYAGIRGEPLCYCCQQPGLGVSSTPSASQRRRSGMAPSFNTRHHGGDSKEELEEMNIVRCDVCMRWWHLHCLAGSLYTDEQCDSDIGNTLQGACNIQALDGPDSLSNPTKTKVSREEPIHDNGRNVIELKRRSQMYWKGQRIVEAWMSAERLWECPAHSPNFGVETDAVNSVWAWVDGPAAKLKVLDTQSKAPEEVKTTVGEDEGKIGVDGVEAGAKMEESEDRQQDDRTVGLNSMMVINYGLEMDRLEIAKVRYRLTETQIRSSFSDRVHREVSRYHENHSGTDVHTIESDGDCQENSCMVQSYELGSLDSLLWAVSVVEGDVAHAPSDNLG
jgi:hypothetical protein